MKKLFALSALTIAPLLAQQAFAGGPGCGLGAQLFDGKTGTVNHVLAATTNGTFGNQTFGMTFGTLGCDTSETISMAALYIDRNIDRVAVDMATGQGEALDALASLLKIEAVDREHFMQTVKAQFVNIYASSDSTSQEVYQALKAVMAEDTVLAKYAV